MAEPASTRSAATGPATGEAWSATARSAAIPRTADSRGTGKSGLAEMLLRTSKVGQTEIMQPIMM